MTALLILAAINWLALPFLGLFVALSTWSAPYTRRGVIFYCRASRLLRWITPRVLPKGTNGRPFDARSFTWTCWSFTFGPDLVDHLPSAPVSADAAAWVAGAAIRADRRLVKHEGNHGFWALVLGALIYGGAYGLGALWAVARGGHWHEDNPLEIVARRAELR